MTDPPNWKALRRKCRPNRILVELVGESPPAGLSFFYLADSNLFRYTEGAFGDVFGGDVPRGVDFLRYFQNLGFYLDDLCEFPVNGLERSERREARKTGVAPLAARLRCKQPRAIVSVMAGVVGDVREAVRIAGLAEVPFYSLPFPAQGHQREYQSGLSTLLLELSDASVLGVRPWT